MADRYANQEDAMTAEDDDQPRQKEKKDTTESSKPKDHKRKSEGIVAVTEHGWLPRPPRPDNYQKLMESPCPFHPKGKHAAKDCYALKRFAEECAHQAPRGQERPDRCHDQDNPRFPEPQSELHMIYRGSASYESKLK